MRSSRHIGKNFPKKENGVSCLLISFLLVAAGLPMMAFAQAYVPVIDIRMDQRFPEFVAKFDQYALDMNNALTRSPDSLRDIIAGPNPQGVAAEDCHMRDANDYVWAYSNGPWATAIASTSNGLPATVPAGGVVGTPGPDYIQVFGQGPGGTGVEGNDSGSIRCILTALVGYQKIALYVQINQLLKQYIADAQQKQLSNQMLNRINAANLNWGRQGEQVLSNNMPTTEPVYVLNSTQSGFNENTRTTDMIVAQTTAVQGDPVGTLNIEPAWQLDVATQVALQARNQTEDQRAYFPSETQSTLTTPDGPFPGSGSGSVAFDNYMRDANTPNGIGAVDTLASMLNNPQNTPIGAVELVTGENNRRIIQEQERRNKGEANDGFRPTKVCSGNAGDPYCDPAYMTDVSPGAQNQEVITGAVQSGNEQIARSDNLDTTSADAATSLSAEANTQPSGVYGYNTTGLAATQTGVNELIKELYDTIQYAYFDLNGNQEEWAQGALLSIYDEMKFNDQRPQEVVTNGTAPVPVPY